MFKHFIVLSASALLLLAGASARAQVALSQVELRVTGILDAQGVAIPAAREGEEVTLQLELNLTVASKPLSSTDLLVNHEKLFHFLSYDLGLTNYQHLHPDYNPATKRWEVLARFPRAGSYKIWADVLLKAEVFSGGGGHDGHGEPHSHGEHAHAAHEGSSLGDDGLGDGRLGNGGGHGSPGGTPVQALATIQVEGASPPLTAPNFTDADIAWEGADRGSVIQIGTHMGGKGIKAGQDPHLMLSFAREDGSKPQLSPYLGAMAHVIFTDLSGTAFIHAHPMQMGSHFMFHGLVFPSAGYYRAFCQFVDAGILRTVELLVRVDA